MDYPYVFLDAIYCKARVGHRVLSQAIVVAFGVAADGRREVLGFDVGDPAGSAAKDLSGFSAFPEGVGDAFAFDLVIYLRESGHDREQHLSCCGWPGPSLPCSVPGMLPGFDCCWPPPALD